MKVINSTSKKFSMANKSYKQLEAEEEIDSLLKNKEAIIAKQAEDLKNTEREKEEERLQKEEERRQKEEMINTFVKYLIGQGKSVEEIMEATNLTKELVVKLMRGK